MFKGLACAVDVFVLNICGGFLYQILLLPQVFWILLMCIKLRLLHLMFAFILQLCHMFEKVKSTFGTEKYGREFIYGLLLHL